MPLEGASPLWPQLASHGSPEASESLPQTPCLMNDHCKRPPNKRSTVRKDSFIHRYEASGKPEHDINTRVVSFASQLQNEKDHSALIVQGYKLRFGAGWEEEECLRVNKAELFAQIRQEEGVGWVFPEKNFSPHHPCWAVSTYASSSGL